MILALDTATHTGWSLIDKGNIIESGVQDGEKKTGRELGFKDRHSYCWTLCLGCGRGKWIRVKEGKPESMRCHSCAAKGENSAQWKGGVHTQHKRGYVLVWVNEDDPYHKMAKNHNRVLEHRLVMARHLGRCLESWEVVHHKNGIKTDNRIANLELIDGQLSHMPSIHVQKRINSLQKKVDRMKTLMKELREENKKLRRSEI